MLRPRKSLRIEPLERRELMAVVSGDFNGDGFQDVAYGRPEHNAAADIAESGAVSIQYGTAGGLQSTTQAFDQDSPGVPGAAESGDQFGAALAVGDFNGDGYDDLAVGVPGEDSHKSNVGAVHVFYGSFFGLQTQFGSRLLTTENGSSRFGYALAAGNFDGDVNPQTGLPIDDLAVGLPDADHGFQNIPIVPDSIDGYRPRAGMVRVYRGTIDGIGLRSTQFFTQEGKIVGSPERDDRFGSALVAGDFNGDGFDDLAIGTPNEDLHDMFEDAGAVYILAGSEDGLVKEGNFALFGPLTEKKGFGGHLAAGDFNGDGISDLVVVSLGIFEAGELPGQFDPGGGPDLPGNVTVYFGSTGQLGAADSQSWETSSEYRLSETPVAVGDYNGDGIDDLVFIDGLVESIAELFVQHGGVDGLRQASVLTTNTPGLAADTLSFQLTTGDYNGDGLDDLAAFTRLPRPSSVLSSVLVGSIAKPPGLGGRFGRLQVIEGTNVLGLQVAGNYTVNLHGPGSGSGIVGLANTTTTGSALSDMVVVEEDSGGAERLTDAAAVEKLFQQILGRAPETKGLAYYVNRLAQGASLSSVAAGIFESPERLDPIIGGMYRDYLLRDAGPAEIAYYREQWQREGSPDQIKANIISSPEFYQSAGATDAGWVGELYQRLLGRAAGQAEIQYWTDRLAQGAARTQVVFGFLRSDESYRNLALAWYQQYLNRQPTQEEMAGVVAAMRAGATQRDVQMQLIDTDEYRRVPA